jgi:hypothetical protein
MTARRTIGALLLAAVLALAGCGREEGGGADGAAQQSSAIAEGPDVGGVGVALWNVTLDQTRSTGEPLLDRRVTLRVEGLAAAAYAASGGAVELAFDLPMPSVSLVELVPA